MKRLDFIQHILLAGLILGIQVASAQSDAARQKQFNLQKSIALEGYDPVSYFSGKPEEGSRARAETYKGITYYFSSDAHREQFRQSPERFEPAYGGWCAYAMGATGEKVKVDPETFKIRDGRLYLFYNFWGNNTLEKWNKNEATLKATADQKWHAYFP